MDIKKELIIGKGYAVFPIEKIDVFKKLRDTFIQNINISNKLGDNIDQIRKKIAKMSKAEINKIMVNLLSFNDLSDMIINSCPTLIKRLCGSELFIQRRAHTNINVPGHGQAKVLPHYELMSGISPFCYVIWAPLHDLEDQGGVYYIDQKKSLEIMKKEEEEGLVNGHTIFNLITDQKATLMKFGEAIIFNPFVLHGNITFESEFARIACNVRFQSYNKPLLQKNTDYLKYYKLV